MTPAKAVPAKIFDDFLSRIQLESERLDELAWSTGWSKAQPRKITLDQRRLAHSPELAGMIARALADLGKPDEPEPEEARLTWNHLVLYCCYDKRKRKNFFDQSND